MLINAYACQSTSYPGPSGNLIELLDRFPAIELAEFECVDCKFENLSEFRVKKQDQTEETRVTGFWPGYHLDVSMGQLIKRPYFTWVHKTCKGLPAIDENRVYASIIDKGRLVWSAPLSNFYRHKLSADAEDERYQLFYRALAEDVFRSADVYWKCDPSDKRRVLEMTPEYEFTGQNQYAYRATGQLNCARGLNNTAKGISLFGYSTAELTFYFDGKEIVAFTDEGREIKLNKEFKSAIYTRIYPEKQEN